MGESPEMQMVRGGFEGDFDGFSVVRKAVLRVVIGQGKPTFANSEKHGK
jgi:hypothetical protein